MEKIVTVIIPSYNRAHLLERTVPTYMQEGVKEIILVDDCSMDNTPEVVCRLQQKIPQLKYIRQPQNMRQTAAKNRGLELVETEWVYFGDDDSILYPGSIKQLYETCVTYGVEACGAAAYYMKPGEEELDMNEYISRNQVFTDDLTNVVNINTMHACFSYSVKHPIEVPFCHAALIIKTSIARMVKFDLSYTGNAYREETDFILRCGAKGVTFMYDSRAAQINLPAYLATGGARSSKSKWKYKRDMIINNWRFLKRNHKFMRDNYNVSSSKYCMQLQFMLGFIARPLNRVFQRLW